MGNVGIYKGLPSCYICRGSEGIDARTAEMVSRKSRELDTSIAWQNDFSFGDPGYCIQIKTMFQFESPFL